jgi:hypothetical protein
VRVLRTIGAVLLIAAIGLIILVGLGIPIGFMLIEIGWLPGGI